MAVLAAACPWADAILIAAFRGADTIVVFGHGDRAARVDVSSLAPPLRALIDGQQTALEALRAENAALSDRNRSLEERSAGKRNAHGAAYTGKRTHPVDWQFTLALAAYDLIRLPKLLRAAA